MTSPRHRLSTLSTFAVLGGSLLLVSGCSMFGGDDGAGDSVSVFDVAPRDCFLPLKKVEAEVSSLNRVDCGDPHALEAYAAVPFRGKDDAATSEYPGNETLTAFAEGACAQKFAPYVGTDYRDSSLFFTYLLPSARSWEQGSDRKVFCFITTAGKQLSSSAQGSKS